MDANKGDQNPEPPPPITPPPPTLKPPSPKYDYSTFEEPNKRVRVGRFATSALIIVVIALINVARYASHPDRVRDNRDHTRVFYKGRELSRAEIKQTSDDLSGITGTSNESDAGALNTSYPAKSEVGRAFEDLMREMQAIRASIQKVNKGTNSKDYLSPPQLGTATGRASARAIHESYATASPQYWAQVRQWNVHLLEFAHEMAAGGGDNTAMMSQITQLSKLDNTNSQSIDQLLDLVDKARPTYDERAKKLAFSAKAIEDQYDHLHAVISANDKSLNKLQDDLVAAQGDVLDRTFRSLAESVAPDSSEKS